MNYTTLHFAAKHVIGLYQKDIQPYLKYHNLSHTRAVVFHAREIAAHYKLSENRTLVLCLAAWFHDVGHLYSTPENHEDVSIDLMTAYLGPHCAPETISEIKNIILATRYSTIPVTFLEQILCDADSFHFGTGHFLTTDELVKEEMELRTGTKLSTWKQHALELLRTHNYYTGYCKDLLNEGKNKNYLILSGELHPQ